MFDWQPQSRADGPVAGTSQHTENQLERGERNLKAKEGGSKKDAKQMSNNGIECQGRQSSMFMQQM